MYVLDTNILLDYPTIVEDDEFEFMIPLCVLKELDGLKNSVNQETSFNARRAAILISRNMKRENLHWFTDECYNHLLVDEQLLEITTREKATLITNDIYLKIKANSRNIDNIGWSKTDNYTGICTLSLPFDECLYNEQLDKIIQGNAPKEIKDCCFNNEFLIIKSENQNSFEPIAFQYKNGNFEQLKKNYYINNNVIDKLVGRNPEQNMLIKLLQDDDITIVAAQGVYGSGKSFIVNNYAISQLEKEKIKKIVYVPNNAYTENAMEIGYLKGDQLEKLTPSIGPLIDLIGIDYVNEWIAREMLEVVPLGFIRGRSFENTIIIVNEAQNLTEDHIKLLIARCGENSKIIFDGDVKQADSNLFRNKNGLKLLSQLRFSLDYSQIFGTVSLKTVERSKTARAAEFLDELT